MGWHSIVEREGIHMVKDSVTRKVSPQAVGLIAAAPKKRRVDSFGALPGIGPWEHEPDSHENDGPTQPRRRRK